MKKIEYRKEIFDIVNDLSQINNSVIFEKEDDKVVIKAIDAEKTIAYVLEAPKSFFDFEDDQIAFYNYNEFYQFFRAVEAAEMKKTESMITLCGHNSKISYLLSNPESIGPSAKRPGYANSDLKFNLTAYDLSEIIKMNSLIKAKRARIYGDSKSINIRLYNDLHDNSFEKTYDIENLSGFDKEFDFAIFSEHFEKLPSKKDYVVEIKCAGFVKFSLANNDINLNIYTGYVTK
jgi:hypothetical protein